MEHSVIYFLILYRILHYNVLYFRILPCKCEFTILQYAFTIEKCAARIKCKRALSMREKNEKNMYCRKQCVMTQRKVDDKKLRAWHIKKILFAWSLGNCPLCVREVQWERGSYRTHVVFAYCTCIIEQTCGSPGCKNGNAFGRSNHYAKPHDTCILIIY